MSETKKKTGLDLLREPFPSNQISKLPKESRAQIDERKANRAAGVNCQLCGSWHHKNAVHLDYVGHAALTDRLLDADQNWSWEPLALRDGLPAFDTSGGLWIKLTVCGATRLGYGHAAAKQTQDPGAREKEVIGDALRNAAMRFGAALDLWHKGDLHGADESGDAQPERETGAGVAMMSAEQIAIIEAAAKAAGKDIARICKRAQVASLADMPADWFEAVLNGINQKSTTKEAA